MAFADLGSLGATGSSGNNQSSLALTLGATGVAIGELVVIVVADDNIGTGADADGAEVASVADSGGNRWVKAKGWTLTTGGAQNGASCSLWWTVATTAIAATTGTITATFTNNTLSDATAMTARHFSFVGRVAVENTNASTQTAGTDPNSLDAVTANIACLRIRGFACEVGNNTNLTPTANWVAWANGNSATSGTTAEMVARAEHHISTGTGDASDPTYAITADYAHVYVAFREQIPYPLDWPNPQHRLAAAAHIALRAEPEVNQLSRALYYVAPAVTYEPRSPLILDGWGPLRLRDVTPQQTLLQTTLAGAAPVAPPFAPLDYPNPRGPSYPVSLRTLTAGPRPVTPANTETTRDPLVLRGWLPPSSISLLTWIDQIRRHLIGQDVFFDGAGRAPVYDWPNPSLGRPYPTDLRTFIGFPSLGLLTPIGRTTDWANPKGATPSISLRTHLQAINIPLSQTMGAINYNWPNPKGTFANLRDIPQSLLQTTLGAPPVPGVPFVQTDWPNPVQPIARLRGDVQPENRALFEPVVPYTFRQPVVQFSWVRQVQHPQPANLLETTLGGTPAAAPFVPVSWPNPSRSRDALWAQIQPHRVAFEGLDTFFGEPGQVPTQRFPNPRGPLYPTSLLSWIGKFDPTAVVAAPKAFAQTDWAVPRGPRYPTSLLSWIGKFDPTAVVVADTSQLRSPVFLAGWRIDPGAAIRAQSDVTRFDPTPTGPKPFAQNDWPDPKGPLYPVSLRTHVEPLKLNLLGKDAFFYGAGRGPVYDYPNPRGPQFPSDLRTFTQTLPVQTYVTPVQGYNNYDWPNPKGPLFSIGLYTHVDQSRILTYVPPEPVVIPPIPPVDELGGTTSRGGGTRRHHPAFTKKEYYKLIEQWAREAAAKTAEIVDTEKKVVPTKKSVIAATRRATIAESERLQTIWAETAARIAEIEAIDSKYQKMAADLAAHFGRLAADLEDEDEIVALLLS